MEVSVVWLAGGFRRFEAFAFAEVDSLKRGKLVVCVGCSVEGERRKVGEVWLFKCSFDGIRVKALMLDVLVK